MYMTLRFWINVLFADLWNVCDALFLCEILQYFLPESRENLFYDKKEALRNPKVTVGGLHEKKTMLRDSVDNLNLCLINSFNKRKITGS